MTSEIKNEVRPLYAEFLGYLYQAPTSKDDEMSDEGFWDQYNESVELLSKITDKDYSRFKIEPISLWNDDYDYLAINVNTYRQKLGGLISRLHGEYFSKEPAPFSKMPGTVITQTQQQNMSMQMFFEFQNTIDEKIEVSKEGSKEESFLKKFKKALSSASDLNDVIRKFVNLANESGLNFQDIIRLWS